MKDMEAKVRAAINQQCQSRGFCSPTDVLMDIGTLDRRKYEDWLFGRIPYLEAICNANLHKLMEILKQMSSELYAVRQKKSSRHETYCILPQCV